jgi:GTP-binding protein
LQIAAEFVTSAAGAGDFPRDALPEITLIGRSNVGKSTLINALVRRPVARTSAAPGKTRLANFYRVQRGSGPGLYLVDLPGYGYARGGGPAAEEFNRLTKAYFARARGAGAANRDALSGTPSAADVREKDIAALLLVDARHPGLESDLTAWEWLKTQPCPRSIVGTKVDKLTRAERMRNTRQLESLFDVPVLLVSAQDGEGLEQLWKLIARLPNQTAA